jgi:hypothetical protein
MIRSAESGSGRPVLEVRNLHLKSAHGATPIVIRVAFAGASNPLTLGAAPYPGWRRMTRGVVCGLSRGRAACAQKA